MNHIEGVIPCFYREPMRRSETLTLFTSNLVGQESVLTNFTMESIDPCQSAPYSARIECSREGIQRMFDDLWALGYRPSEKFQEFTSPSMEHIKDMRLQAERSHELLRKAMK